MRNKAVLFGKRILKQELVKGSMYIFVGMLIANVFNFLFNLFMSRNLAVEDYGILTSAISLVTLVITPFISIIPTIVNFTGSSFAKQDFEQARLFLLKITKPLILVGFVFLFTFIFFANEIGNFFNIKDESIIVIVGFIIFVSYLGIINTGVLQAKLEFKFISLSNVVSALIKLLVGVILVFFGFGLKGAIWVLFFSGIGLFVISFIPLRFIFKIKRKSREIPAIHFRELLSYGAPSAIATLSLISLISMDILLVKHFFDPLQAGIYAGLSLVGRVIFFLTAPISMVMFGLIVQKREKGENYEGIFKTAILLVVIPSILISVFYFLYPNFTIGFFIKNKIYLSVSSLLGLFAVFISTYSLSSLFVFYFLSIKKTKVYMIVASCSIAQVILIILYHDSLYNVVTISLAVSIILFILLLSYFIKIIVDRNKL